jgi:hypothetical protein
MQIEQELCATPMVRLQCRYEACLLQAGIMIEGVAMIIPFASMEP